MQTEKSEKMTPVDEQPNPYRIEVGKRVQELRKCKKVPLGKLDVLVQEKTSGVQDSSTFVTQEKLAVVLGISHRHMVNIEAGNRGLTSERAIILADLYSVSLDYIFLGRTAEENMAPVCQLVYDTFKNMKSPEQERAFMDLLLGVTAYAKAMADIHDS
jgi:transcriptional regulator with XRE-family HTH domain